jgi:hypothetical protein
MRAGVCVGNRRWSSAKQPDQPILWLFDQIEFAGKG